MLPSLWLLTGAGAKLGAAEVAPGGRPAGAGAGDDFVVKAQHGGCPFLAWGSCGLPYCVYLVSPCSSRIFSGLEVVDFPFVVDVAVIALVRINNR